MSSQKLDHGRGAPPPRADQEGPDQQRRDLLMVGATGVLGAGIVGAVLGPGIASLVYPLNHETISRADAFLPAGKLDRFKSGEPFKVDLVADRRDAWNRMNGVVIGASWVVRRGDQLTALSTECPHLGCAVNYDAAARRFNCPCHGSIFALDGSVEAGPAPRPMDTLETRTEGGLLAIRYERFKEDRKEKQRV